MQISSSGTNLSVRKTFCHYYFLLFICRILACFCVACATILYGE